MAIDRTHRATWTLSKPPDPETWQVPGEVDLQQLRQPGGGVFGKAPVNWTRNGNSMGAGFPQRFKYPLVRGELDGGLDAVLIDAVLTVSDHITTGEALPADQRERSFGAMVEIALAAAFA